MLLRKGVYSKERMNEWENFNETPLPGKEEFYRKLNVEHIIDTD